MAYALGGMDAVGRDHLESGLGSFVQADWKEGPVVLHRILAMVAEHVRPDPMPGTPPLAFGEDALPALREVARQIDSSSAKLLSIEDGSDEYFVALVPADFDLDKAEEAWSVAEAEHELQETACLAALAEAHPLAGEYREDGDGNRP